MEILERKVTNELVTAEHLEGSIKYKFNATLKEDSNLQRVDGTIERNTAEPKHTTQVGSFNYNESDVSVRVNKGEGITNAQAATIVEREIENLKAVLAGKNPASSQTVNLEEEVA